MSLRSASVAVESTISTPPTVVRSRKPKPPLPHTAALQTNGYDSWNDKLSNKFLSYRINNIFGNGMKRIISNILFIISLAAIIPIGITIFNVVKQQDASGLVFWAIILSIIISSIWILYGFFVIKNFVVVLSSLLILTFNSILAYYVNKYG